MSVSFSKTETTSWDYITEPHCINCADYVQANDELGYCLSEDIKAYLEGGLQSPIRKPDLFVCPCWKMKIESVGKGGG